MRLFREIQSIMATNISAIVAQLPPYLQEQIPRYKETLRPNIYAATGISLLLAYVCVSLRLYGRRLQGQSLWWDDYMSIVALVSQFNSHDEPTIDEINLTMRLVPSCSHRYRQRYFCTLRTWAGAGTK